MKKIVCFHLYNDYSGSPKVLSSVLKGLVDKGYHIDIMTSRKGGMLDELEDYPEVKFSRYWYKFSENLFLGTLRYASVQLYTFIYSFKYLFRKDTVFYINTLLPLGAAVAGRIMGKKVIYHYHENADAKGGIYKLLAKTMEVVADTIICVSDYQASFLKNKEKVIVIPNVLPVDYVNEFSDIESYSNYEKKNVLMLSSLKTYKGLKEFAELALRIPDCLFTLVINDDETNIDCFFKSNGIKKVSNLRIYPRQKNVVPFFRDASIVLNLSDKRCVVETFGMTVLEAFTAGLPVIVPTTGGIAELVDENINGYKIDVTEIDKIESRIREVLENKSLYDRLRRNAKLKSASFTYSNMIDNIEKIVKR